jgi:hypothetical protein
VISITAQEVTLIWWSLAVTCDGSVSPNNNNNKSAIKHPQPTILFLHTYRCRYIQMYVYIYDLQCDKVGKIGDGVIRI